LAWLRLLGLSSLGFRALGQALHITTPQSDNAPSHSHSNKKKKEKDKHKKMKRKKDNNVMSITGSIPPYKPFLYLYILMPNISPQLPADHLGEPNNTSIPLLQSSKVGSSGTKWLEPSGTSHEQPAKKKQ